MQNPKVNQSTFDCSAATTRILDYRPRRVWAMIENCDTGAALCSIYFGGEAAAAGIAGLHLPVADDGSSIFAYARSRIIIDDLHPWVGEVFGAVSTAIRVVEFYYD